MALEVGYRITGRVENVEIRFYPPMILACVSGQTESEAFSCLIRYISGDNKSGEKIPMTSPVITEEMIPEAVHYPPPHERHHPHASPTTDGVQAVHRSTPPGTNPGIYEGIPVPAFSRTSPATYHDLLVSGTFPPAVPPPEPATPDPAGFSTGGIIQEPLQCQGSLSSCAYMQGFPLPGAVPPGSSYSSGAAFRVQDDLIPVEGCYITPDPDPLYGAVRSDQLPAVPSSKVVLTPTMTLVIPGGIPMAKLPLPLDKRIQFQEVPAREIAVVRFSGKTGRRSVREKISHLLAVLRRHSITTTGNPFLMRYNPPIVPETLRKNEVGIVVIRDHKA